MLTHSSSFISMLLVDEVGSLLQFPVWWYGKGLLELLIWIKNGLLFRWKKYALGLWIRNFFVPMYGDHEFSGRLMSIFMRLVVIIGRLLALCAEAWAYLILLALWIAAPVFCVLMLGRLALESLVNLVS